MLPHMHLLNKEINLSYVHYGCISEAINLISDRSFDLSDLIGEYYLLDDFNLAFDDARKSETKKIFFKMVE